MRNKWGILAATLGLTLAACGGGTTTTTTDDGSTAPATGGSRLEVVKQRGQLICGVDGGIPGFSFVDETGTYTGLDVDVCKAVAAAVLGDAEKVEYRRLDSTERFTALAGGEVDMLSRNTTWTISRDTSVGLEFAPTTFFDGQGMMVRTDSGIESLEDFAGKAICVETGTTTELNLTDQMRQLDIDFEPVVFQDADAAYAAYNEGRCEGMTSDKSQLIGRRSTLPTPEDHILLEVTMSKEPLGPVTVNNDSAWYDVVKWVTFGLMQAEEFGITSENIGTFAGTDNPDIARFLGQEGTLGTDMGLPNDFMVQVVTQVGNYGEIFDRNLGADSQFELERGQNALWTEGGLMYAPPFR
ncbi:amino acid ABC transporter substrate-binding protein [Phormidium sp. FACHB-1136]|jgi:general L-amino acid transport system substrate-binding protein|uniref:amino acid ABC transporter substrate-binding protein n=1 Tax=Phormidium sp. FACHB-1136 TaxID=2692848 RepID=UPI0016883804|nr:amino acid ABC transporter substrate-binding protein [Phormidium sp. FACHB-1136]MBD2425519.1 amino acid ABC transporter substrate-binding protein [Phormidium sp. FACHB-1136]